jgi:hypothetical protein
MSLPSPRHEPPHRAFSIDTKTVGLYRADAIVASPNST